MIFIVLNFALFSLIFIFFSSLLDRNIDETGNQLYKSNHGPSECCYDYCKRSHGLCSSTCDAIFNRNNETANIASSLTTATTSLSNVDDYDDVDNENGGEITSKQRIRNVTSLMMSTSKLYVKLDNGTYVLNDFSSPPDMTGMSQCPANLTDSNVTLSTTQKCVISQAQVTSSASKSSSSISIFVLLLLLHVALQTSNNLLHLNLVECKNVVVTLLLSSVVVVWKVLLPPVTAAAILDIITHHPRTSLNIITGS